MNIKQRLSVVIIAVLFAISSLTACAQIMHESGTVGALFGALTGALLDSHNRWRGGAIGAAIGGAFGATIGAVMERSLKDAARHGKPYEYYSDDQNYRVYTEPQTQWYRYKGSYDSYHGIYPYINEDVYQDGAVYANSGIWCRRVRERVWDRGRLIGDRTREHCEQRWYRAGVYYYYDNFEW